MLPDGARGVNRIKRKVTFLTRRGGAAPCAIHGAAYNLNSHKRRAGPPPVPILHDVLTIKEGKQARNNQENYHRPDFLLAINDLDSVKASTALKGKLKEVQRLQGEAEGGLQGLEGGLQGLEGLLKGGFKGA